MDENRTDTGTADATVTDTDRPATTVVDPGTEADTTTDRRTDDTVQTGAFAELTTDRWVYVAVQGGQDWKVDYVQGITAGEAVSTASRWGNVTITPGDGRVLTVNGVPVKPEFVLNPNSVVVVTGKVRNG
jgi:hypothetical protein